MAGEVSWWTRAKKDTEDRPHLTSLADLDQPKNGGGSTRPPEGDATASAKRVTFAGDDDESALRAAQHPSVAEFVDDALGRASDDAGAEESKAPGFVPSEAPYVTAEQERTGGRWTSPRASSGERKNAIDGGRGAACRTPWAGASTPPHPCSNCSCRKLFA